MSRSVRKPYSAVTGPSSAHYDKKIAARGIRRKHKQYTNTNWESDYFLIPHRLECNHNDTYDWGRDGSQFYQVPERRHYQDYLEAVELKDKGYGPENYLVKYYGEWPPLWYKRLLRK
jgi:hypothetical protein